MSKGSNRRKEDFKKVQSNWEFIEWRNKGTYCEDCGQNFSNPGQHHWDEKRKTWTCNPNGDCNYN